MRPYGLLLLALGLCACADTSTGAGMPFINLSINIDGQPVGDRVVSVMYYPDIGEREAASLTGPHPIGSFLIAPCKLENGVCIINTKPAQGARRKTGRNQAIEIWLTDRTAGTSGSIRLGYTGWTGQSYPDALQISCDLQAPEAREDWAAAACQTDGIPA